MKKMLILVAAALLVGAAGLVVTPTPASAQKCWYEGTSYDRCNGKACPGGWCCYICTQ